MLVICPAIFEACLIRADGWPACFSLASGVRNLSRAGKLLDPSTLATIHGSHARAFLMATRVIESRSGNADSSALHSGVGCCQMRSRSLILATIVSYTFGSLHAAVWLCQLLPCAAAAPQTQKMTAILASSA
jgi:hypothetical protein